MIDASGILVLLVFLCVFVLAWCAGVGIVNLWERICK